MDMKQRTKTAIHEAGHIVAIIRLGHVPGDVSIQPDYDLGLNGRAEFEGISDYDAQLARDEVIISCAGYAALKVKEYSENDCRLGAERDFEEAEELIAGFELEALDFWLEETVQMISSPENIAAIDRIAKYLLNNSFLRGEHAQVLVDVADGKASEDELAHYEACVHENHHK